MPLSFLNVLGLGHILYALYGVHTGRTMFLATNPVPNIVRLNRKQHGALFWGALVMQIAFGSVMIFFAWNPYLFG